METKRHIALTVYNASAGSGKTFTLAARYVALLLGGASHRSILAVTFTNKATAEMKQRILNFLFGLATRPDEDDMVALKKTMRDFGLTGLDEREITRRAGLQLNAVLQDYDHFTVTTIDSFLQMLLGEVARSAHLQTSYAVELNDQDVVDMAIDYMVSSQEMLDDVTRKRLKILIEDAISEEQSWDIRNRLKSLARELRREAYLRGKDTLDAYLQTDPFFSKYKGLLKASPQAKTIERMSVLLNEWKATFGDTWGCTNANHLRSALKRLENSLKGKAGDEELFVFLKPQLQKSLESGRLEASYEGPSTANEFARRLEEMQALSYECRKNGLNYRKSTEQLGELGLLGSISHKVDEINREANRILLSMTPILLRRVLEHGEDTIFVLEKAGVRFSHVMIDEFQDTSHLQWENFLPLINELLSRNGTALLVGDVKQSIYRWRGGDWDILRGIKDGAMSAFFRDGRAVVKPLSMNYRSAREIVAFNLDFFRKAAKVLGDDIEPIFDENYRPERLNEFCRKENGGYVNLKLYPCKTKSEVSDALLGDMFREVVRMKLQGVAESDMMVLVRGNAEALAVSDYLEEHRDEGFDDITLVSSDAFQLKKSLSVQMLVSGLRCVLRPDDKLSLMFLAYHYQRDVRGTKVGWEQLMGGPKAFLPDDFLALVRDGARLPLYELVESLIRVLLYCDGSRAMQDDGYVFSFMDCLMSYLDDNVSDIATFISYWDETLSEKTIPTPAVSKGIRVMTIHKAKGLEADTVFLPFCDWDIEKDRRGGFGKADFMWCQPRVKPYDAGFSIPVVPSKSVAETIYKEEYESEHFRRRIDNLNLLYVAFTRAKNNLLVFARCKEKCDSVATVGDLIVQTLDLAEQVTANGPDNAGFTALEIGHVTHQVGHALSESRLSLKRKPLEVSLVAHKGRMKFRQSNPSQMFIRPEEDEKSLSRTEYVKMGNLCHQIFSIINRMEDVESALQAFWRDGIIGSKEQMDELRALFGRCWKQPLAREWFDGSWTLFRECDILKREQDGTLEVRRPDRVMKRGDETVVVDFKFGRANRAYSDQVKQYMLLLRDMGYSKVRGYLWYVANETIEEITL